MVAFQFMLDTVEDQLPTPGQEKPLQGTLLRAQLEDEVPQDDGTAMYPFRTHGKILTIAAGGISSPQRRETLGCDCILTSNKTCKK